MNRHKQREYIFRLLFSLNLGEQDKGINNIDVSLASLDIESDEHAQLIKERVLLLVENLDAIDALIASSSDRWEMDRIAKIELSLLRVATFEMKVEGLPVSVAINEAVELAKKYGEDKSSRFVNGVLGQVAKSIDEQE